MVLLIWLSDPVPSWVVPSKKVTVPPGANDVDWFQEIVAVRVTASPYIGDAGLELTVVVVATVVATPIPDKETDCGLLDASSLSVRLPVSGLPLVVGAKATDTLQVDPGVNSTGQVPKDALKFDETEKGRVKFRAVLPTSDTATFCGPLV